MIKVATSDDVIRLVTYGDKFWSQTRYFAAGIEYNTKTVLAVTNALIDDGIVLFAEDDGEVVALMLVIIAPFPMNQDYTAACEWVFYVEPDYRRSGLGIELIGMAETMLKDKGVKFFTMVSLANVEPEAANKLYEYLGFEHSETNYTKDLQWQQ